MEINYIGRRSYYIRTTGDISLAVASLPKLNNASSQSVNAFNHFDLSFN